MAEMLCRMELTQRNILDFLGMDIVLKAVKKLQSIFSRLPNMINSRWINDDLP
jgi:hypothetical protein